MVTKDFDGIKSITMEDHAIYVISDNSSIYKFKVAHGKVTKYEISNALKNASSIVVLDKFLYVIDDVKGLHVLKTAVSDTGYQNEPKLIETGGLKNLRGVTIFRASAFLSLFINLFTLFIALLAFLLM